MLMIYTPNMYDPVVNCGPPPSVPNGSPGTPTPGTTLGGMVTYTCTSGVLVGGATVTCEVSGDWSTTPICLGEHAYIIEQWPESFMQYYSWHIPLQT